MSICAPSPVVCRRESLPAPLTSSAPLIYQRQCQRHICQRSVKMAGVHNNKTINDLLIPHHHIQYTVCVCVCVCVCESVCVCVSESSCLRMASKGKHLSVFNICKEQGGEMVGLITAQTSRRGVGAGGWGVGDWPVIKHFRIMSPVKQSVLIACQKNGSFSEGRC